MYGPIFETWHVRIDIWNVLRTERYLKRATYGPIFKTCYVRTDIWNFLRTDRFLKRARYGPIFLTFYIRTDIWKVLRTDRYWKRATYGQILETCYVRTDFWNVLLRTDIWNVLSSLSGGRVSHTHFHLLDCLYKCMKNIPYKNFRDTRWRSWLRHCATTRKVAGSIPDGFIGIFHWHNPSGRTVALGSTQPLTEMSTRDISWRVKAAGA